MRAGKNGAPEVTDGPSPEAKEFLAGFWIIDCDSKERPMRLPRVPRRPRQGRRPLNMPIEVREVMSAPSSGTCDGMLFASQARRERSPKR